jgi:hypothetical protein
MGSDTKNVITIDQTEEPLKESTVRYSAAMTLGGGFEARYTVSEDTEVGLKYQFYGAPLEEKVVGNISLATSLGYSQDKQTSNGNTLFGSTRDEGFELKYRHADIALISGYRLSANALIYGSVFFQKGDVEGSYKLIEYYDSAIDMTVNEGCGISRDCFTTGISDNGHAYGANLALEYEIWRWFAITGEVVYHKANWFDRSNAETTGNVNLEFRF